MTMTTRHVLLWCRWSVMDDDVDGIAIDVLDEFNMVALAVGDYDIGR